MDKVETLQVLHARGNLSGHVDESSKTERLCAGREMVGVLWQVTAEELGQVAVFQVLHHNKEWFLAHSDTQDSRDVLIFQPRQETNFFDKLVPAKEQVITTNSSLMCNSLDLPLLVCDIRRHVLDSRQFVGLLPSPPVVLETVDIRHEHCPEHSV